MYLFLYLKLSSEVQLMMHIIHMYLCGESMVLTLSFIKTPKKFSYFTIFMHTNFIFFPLRP